MTPERLHKSYRIATQNQKWLPNGYIKSKVDTKWLHKKGAIWELKGSQMVAIFLKFLQRILLYLDNITNFLRSNFAFQNSKLP